MNIEESFDHLEGKIGQAIETINRLRIERDSIREENRNLKELIEKQSREIEPIKSENGEMHRKIQENRHLIENREQIVSHIKNMLMKLEAVQPSMFG